MCVCERVLGVWQRRAPGRWLPLKLACLHSCWLCASGEGFCPGWNILNSSYICRAWEAAVCGVGGTSREQTPLLEAQAVESAWPSQRGEGPVIGRQQLAGPGSAGALESASLSLCLPPVQWGGSVEP